MSNFAGARGARIREIEQRIAQLEGFEKRTEPQEDELGRLRTEHLSAYRAAMADLLRSGDAVAAPGDGNQPVPERAGGDPEPGRPARPTGERGRALDLLERAERTVQHLTRGQLDVVARLVESDESDMAARWLTVTGDDAYLRAFHKVMRNPTMGTYEWTDEERAAFARVQQLQRAMGEGTGAGGGYMVPFALDPAVILTNAGTSNTNLRAAFTVKTIASDVWHGVTSAGVSSHWRGEGLEADDDSPVLDQPSIRTNRADSFIPFSYEVQMDVPGFAEEMSQLLTDGAGLLQAKAFIHGSGTGEPRGIVTAAAAVTGSLVDTAGAAAYSVDDVYATKRALPARWRANAAWLGNEDTYDATRQFATGTGQQSGAFWADLGADTPPKLLGRPVWESSEMDSAVTTGSHLLVYGDLRQYFVVDRVGTTIELVPHLFGSNRRPTGQRGFFMFFRTGGDLVVPDAVRVLTVA